MTSMFDNAIAFNQPLIWDTRNVEHMSWMFVDAIAFNQLLYWNVNNATLRTGMFNNSHGRLIII